MTTKKMGKGKWKRIAAAILAAAMTVSAATPTTLQVQAASKGKVTIQNPISSGIRLTTDSELNGETGGSTETDATYSTINAVAAYVAKHMTDREQSFSVIYNGSDYDSYGDRGKIKNDLLPKVFAIDSASTSDADYLYHIYKSIDIDYVVNSTNKYTKMVFDVEYWESAEETEYVDDNLSTIISDMNLPDGASDYDKIKGVHDWICGNVKKGSSITSEVDQQTEVATLTPYTAFKYGQSSPAGYAALAYKLLYKMGIQTAILQGPEQGSNTKVWNLVQLEGMWYHMSIYDDDKDSRNDGLEGATYDYTYFLLGTNNQRKKLPVGTAYSGYTAYYNVSEEDYFSDNDPIYNEDGKKALYGITAQFVGQEQEIGSFISKGQILVYAYYSKSDYDNKENSAGVRVFDISPARVEKEGDNTVTVSYMGKTCQINIIGSNTPATDGKLKIDFMTNGGSAVDSITEISKNQTISLNPIRPTRDGYQFGGWYLDSTLQTKCPARFTITQSITLYAKWEKIGVSALKAEYKGGPLTVETEYEKNSNGDYIIAEDGKPSIHRWVALLNLNNLEVKAYNSDGTENILTDYNVSLKEGQNDFECAYENGRLLFNKTNQTFPAYGESIILQVEKDGKTDTFEVFLSEYWGEDTNVNSGTVTISVYEDVSAEGVPGAPYVVEVPRYSRFMDAGVKEPSRATETFGGWYLETDYSNRVTDYTRLTDNTSIYAKWEKKTLKNLMVEYTGSDLPIWSNVDLDKVLVKAFYDDYSVKTILDTYEISSTLIEYEGSNVFTVKYQETNPYDADEIISFTRTFTVEGYVPEQETFRVSFDSMGGSLVESISGVAKGETITLPSEPTKEGYIFGGWYRDTSCKVRFTEKSKITKDTTLYAKWEEFQLVPYSLEAAYVGPSLYLGDAIPQDSIRVIAMYNDNVARLVDDFTYTPDTILQDGLNVITVTHENLNASVVIEAGVPGTRYTVTFDSCGGKPVADITGILWGDQITLPTPVKVGDVFLGWYTSKNYATQFTNDDFVTRDMTLYALWGGDAILSGTPIPNITGSGNVTGAVTQTVTPTRRVTPTPTVRATPTSVVRATPTATATPVPTATTVPTVTPETTVTPQPTTNTPTGGAGNVTPTGTEKKTVTSITAEYLGNPVAVGNKIAKENILVTATYSDNTTATVTKFTLTPDTIKAEGTNVVVVKYKKKSATILIEGVAVTAAPSNGAAASGNGAAATKAPSGSSSGSSNSGTNGTNSGNTTTLSAGSGTKVKDSTTEEVQQKISDIFNKARESGSDANTKDLARVLDMIHTLKPRELSELDPDALRTLDDMLKNLNNVTVTIDNHIENYPVRESDIWGLALVLNSSDILRKEPVEVILDISDAMVSSGVRSLLDEYANIQDQSIFKYVDLRVYKYINTKGSSRDEDKRSVPETLLPVHISLPIPTVNQGERYYSVIREHDKKVAAMPDMDGAEETITFESNYFSVYGLAYGNVQVPDTFEEVAEEKGTTVSSDTPANGVGGTDSNGVESMQKSSSNWPFMLAAIAVIALAIMVITIVIVKELNKKDEEEEQRSQPNVPINSNPNEQ
ncbi:MAG: InlB B-repeat-containing protein [Lachnospiraceae bacterium]|nr:InlB B-repeat-containing protein [Lachnospiraceae bacterium]